MTPLIFGCCTVHIGDDDSALLVYSKTRSDELNWASWDKAVAWLARLGLTALSDRPNLVIAQDVEVYIVRRD